MVTIKINDIERRTTVTEQELKAAFETPRGYYNFMKKLHKQLDIPWFDELDVLEWVQEQERMNK